MLYTGVKTYPDGAILRAGKRFVNAGTRRTAFFVRLNSPDRRVTEKFVDFADRARRIWKSADGKAYPSVRLRSTLIPPPLSLRDISPKGGDAETKDV